MTTQTERADWLPACPCLTGGVCVAQGPIPAGAPKSTQETSNRQEG